MRVAGSRVRNDQHKPIAHAKLLVLGEIGVESFGPDFAPDYDEECRFIPQRVWFGSANWTEAARNHLETGFACDDAQLVEEATSFIAEMIAFSEPVDSASVGPEPNLVQVEYDEDAIAQAAAERQFDDYNEDDYDVE
ncbi:hypothetical protein A5738_02885 [Mycobacterium colombiense]|nr:hypothetical protein A5738_02885 [Mycobacterium colombiense]